MEGDEEEVDEVTMARAAVLLGSNNIMMLRSCNNSKREVPPLFIDSRRCRGHGSPLVGVGEG